MCVAIIGTWCSLMLPVWLLLLHVTHVEPFEWPPPDAARGYALVAAMMGAYQVLLFAAIAITSPTFVAVGQLLVPPLSMAYDFLFSGYALSPLGLMGAFTVVVALGVMLSSDQIDARAHPFLRRLCRCRRDNATVSLLHPAAGAQTMVAPPHGGTRASAGRLPAEVSSGAVDAEQGGRVLERPS